MLNVRSPCSINRSDAVIENTSSWYHLNKTRLAGVFVKNTLTAIMKYPFFLLCILFVCYKSTNHISIRD